MAKKIINDGLWNNVKDAVNSNFDELYSTVDSIAETTVSEDQLEQGLAGKIDDFEKGVPGGVATYDSVSKKIESVKTIAALKSYTGMFNGQIVDVEGYRVFDDGGGGQFEYIQGISNSEDGGYILSPSNGANGRWVRLFRGDTINVKHFGMLDNGTGDMASIFNNIKTYSGGKRVIFFPQNIRASGAIYNFTTFPDFTGCIIASEPDVKLQLPTTNSKTFADCKFLNNIIIRSVDRNNEGLAYKNYDIPEYLSSIVTGNIYEEDKIKNLKELDATSFIKRQYITSSDTIIDGVSTIVNSNTVRWNLNALSSTNAGLIDTISLIPTVGREYTATFNTDSTSATSLCRSGIVVEFEGGWALFSLRHDQFCFIGNKKTGAAWSEVTIADNSLTPNTPLVSAAYSVNYDCNPTISTRIVNKTTLEFYVNGGYATSYKATGNIKYIGFGINGAYNSLGNITYQNFVEHDSSIRSRGDVIKLRIHGDSISFGEGSTLSWPKLLSLSLKNVLGISDVTVDNRAVSGETSTQILSRLNNGGSVSAFKYVICMVGTNDIQFQTDITTFENNLTQMYNKIITDGSTPIFVIPPMFIDQASTGSGFATSNYKKGGLYRSSIMKICGRLNIACVDVNSDFGKISATNKQLRDNIHPHSFYYTFIAKSIASKIITLYSPERVDIRNTIYRVGNNTILYSNSKPITGSWKKGDMWINTDGSTGVLYSLCISDGIPGIWEDIESKTILDNKYTQKVSNQDIEITDATKGVILKAPNNTRYRITVSNEGNLITTAL